MTARSPHTSVALADDGEGPAPLEEALASSETSSVRFTDRRTTRAELDLVAKTECACGQHLDAWRREHCPRCGAVLHHGP